MAYRSFIFSGATVDGNSILLDTRESHHLVRVLRARVGTPVEVLNGLGRRYVGKISIADAKAVEIAVDEIIDAPKPKTRVTLVQSIPKGKTMDLILKMATEIGASAIQPVFTDQGEVQIKGGRLQSKAEKWKTTTIESCKQCGLSYLPELGEPRHLSDWITSASTSVSSLRIVASLEDGSRPLRELLAESEGIDSVEIAVGPEGDFTQAEYALLRANGFQPVRLGANVLRSETAAAYILSVVDQCFA